MLRKAFQNLSILQLLDDLPGFPGLIFCYGFLFQELLHKGLGRRVHFGDGLFGEAFCRTFGLLSFVLGVVLLHHLLGLRPPRPPA